MKRIKKIGEWLSIGILGTLVLIVLFLMIGPQFGWLSGSIISGSMEPTLKEGEVIIAQPVSLEEIKRGDIITFQPEKDLPLVVHRVIKVIQEDGEIYFQTKGDALQESDPWLIGKSNFLGKLFFHLPYFGGLASFLKSKGIYPFLFGIIAVMLIGVLTRDLWKGILEEKERRKLKASNNPEKG